MPAKKEAQLEVEAVVETPEAPVEEAPVEGPAEAPVEPVVEAPVEVAPVEEVVAPTVDNSGEIEACHELITAHKAQIDALEARLTELY